MTYPPLPPQLSPHQSSSSYLHAPPAPALSSSASASSVEPITPELVQESTAAAHITRTTTTADDMAAEDRIPCKWKGCDHHADAPEDLYDHLCNAHVGRKSTNNLCLTCGWEGCGVKCVKRDHITSHLRVHTPLKPHPCAVCGKSFKRPQDLKKHERIHTQEHHALHKLSKATTSSDPAFNARHHANNIIDDRRPSVGHAGYSNSPASQSLSPSSSSLQPSSPYDHLLPSVSANHHRSQQPQGGGAHESVSPTPSALAALHRKQHEELAAYQQREMMILQQLAVQQQQSQAYAAQLATMGYGGGMLSPNMGSDGQLRAGAKRGISADGSDEGYAAEVNGFEGFLADMKKRRVEPVYDADMINRLNSLVPPSLPPSFSSIPALPALPTFPSAYPSFQPPHPPPNYQPPAYPPPPPQHLAMQPQTHAHLPLPSDPINLSSTFRDETDLAAFNQFMLALGKDAAQPMAHAPSYESGQGSAVGSSPSSSADQSSLEDLFASEELARLGLSGLPGIPEMDASAQDHSQQHQHQHVGSQAASLPGNISFGGLYPSLENFTAHRPRTGSAPEDYSRRTIASLPRASASAKPAFHQTSGHSNPYPELPDPSASSSQGSGFSFETLAKPRHSLPATMAPRDFYKKTYRHVAPLGASPASRLAYSAERGTVSDEPDELDDDEEEDLDRTPKISVRSLLLSEDEVPGGDQVRLPAIHAHADRDDGEAAERVTLPSIGRVTADLVESGSGSRSKVPVKRHTEEEIVRGVKRLELESKEGSPAPSARGVGGGVGGAEGGGGGGLREMRKRHQALIMSWMLAVNVAWRRRKIREDEEMQRREEEDDGNEDEEGMEVVLDDEKEMMIKEEREEAERTTPVLV